MSDTITIREAAEILGVSRQRATVEAHSGHLGAMIRADDWSTAPILLLRSNVEFAAQTGTYTSMARHEYVILDAEHLASYGVPAHEVVERLQYSAWHPFYQMLHRNGREDLAEKLRRNSNARGLSVEGTPLPTRWQPARATA